MTIEGTATTTRARSRSAALIVAALLLLTPLSSGTRVFAGLHLVAPEERGGNLHILVIGIDEYPSPYPPLHGAKKDALGVRSAFSARGRRPYEQVFATQLLDGAATRAAMEAAFVDLRLAARPEDTFVFAFSGLGHNVDPSAAEQKMTPAPGTAFLVAGDGEAIPGRVLTSWLRQVPAKNKLIVIDGCYGALAYDDTRTASAIEGGEPVASVTETNVLVIGTDGMTYETARGGALTTGILDSLAGPADIDHDGLVTARELAAVVPMEVLKKWSVQAKVHVRTSFRGEDFTLLRSGATDHGDDSEGPRVTVLEPALDAHGGLSTSASVITLRVRVEDTSGVAGVRINGRDRPLSPDGTFTESFEVSSGQSVVEIVANDVSGNSTWRAVRIHGDGATRGPTRGANDLGPDKPKPPKPLRKSFALLFGTDRYSNWDKLSNPVLDAQTLADHLRKEYDFERVEVVSDGDEEAIRKAIIALREVEYGEQDQLFVFFAGHGTFNDDANDGFLVMPTAPKALDPRDPKLFLQHASLFRMVDGIRCRHILLVMDSCFSGSSLPGVAAAVPSMGSARRHDPVAPSRLASAWIHRRLPLLVWPALVRLLSPLQDGYAPVSDDEFIARLHRKRTRTLITSGGKEYVPDGAPGAHSPFAARFIEALGSRGGDGILTTDEVCDRLVRVNPEPRRARFASDDGGQFVFVAKPAGRAPGGTK